MTPRFLPLVPGGMKNVMKMETGERSEFRVGETPFHIRHGSFEAPVG